MDRCQVTKSATAIPETLANGVFGPDGNLLTLTNLPFSDTVRWVARSKAELTAAVNGRWVTLDDACERYGITRKNFAWRDWMTHFGMAGLYITKSLIRQGTSKS